MTPEVLVEACVTSPAEAVTSFTAGAGRVELCRCLEVGGLTPSHEDVRQTIRDAPGPTHVLVRPQAEGFRLAPSQVGAVIDEIHAFADSGAAGVVVGILDRSGRVDLTSMAEAVDAARGLPVTFHRAWDEIDDPVSSVDVLVRAGVARVLTSGGAPTAWNGRTVLRDLVAACGQQLGVIGAGGVRGDHARQLVGVTGLREVHARAAAIPGIVAALR